MSRKKSAHPGILIAGDCDVFLRDLEGLLRNSGFNQVVCARNGNQAIDELSTSHFDLAIIDVVQSPADSIEVLRATRRLGLQTAIVVLSESGSIEQAVEAMREGARHYFAKPVEEESFIATISSLLERNLRSANPLGFKLDVYLREHSSTANLRLADLCREFAISPSYLARIFRSDLGTTFKRRLNFHRVEKARKLLETTNYAIWEIAEKCGFNNYRRLAEAFKRAGEMPPSVYRLMFRSRKAVAKKAAGKNAPPEK